MTVTQPAASARHERIARWCMRVAFFAVFAVNVECALVFIINPAGYAGGYELSGIPGEAAIRGMGITFLMWNATYPAFIVRPDKYRVLGPVILAQQVIGLVGESFIWAGLPAGHAVLAGGVRLFVLFDAGGLVLMGATFIWWTIARRRAAVSGVQNGATAAYSAAARSARGEGVRHE